MKNLVIVGAGGFGQEFYSWCLPLDGKEWTIKGFLDDNLQALDNSKIDSKVLATVAAYTPQQNDIFICAIGSGAGRLKVVKILQEQGGRFINFIHPSALICQPVQMGMGNIFGPFVYIGIHASIGDFNFFNVASSVGHHVRIANGCTVNSHADVTGNVILEDEVFLGSHACIIPKKTIGKNAKVGAGSAVMHNVASGTTVLGVPAKRLM